MGLQSRTFAGDSRLEAAARADVSHIVPGSSGPHVAKIQSALIELDGAQLASSDLTMSYYGHSTANAVLAFKAKRNIINRAYQTTADNIVGRMTIAALDRELLAKESAPRPQVRLEPVLGARRASDRRSIPVGATSMHFAPGLGRRIMQAPQIGPDTLDIQMFESASFRVTNGVGGVVYVADPSIGVIFDPANVPAAGTRLPVTDNPHLFSVRGLAAGATFINYQSLFSITRPLALVVRGPKPAIKRTYTLGYVPHHHKPCGKWSVIQKNPNNPWSGMETQGAILSAICRGCSTPRCVVDKVLPTFFDKSIALDHLQYYLNGIGHDYDEDGNISTWLKVDRNIRRQLRGELADIDDKRGKKAGKFEWTQADYKNEDFQYAWGSLDRVDFEFDFDLQTVSIWFKDCYEWHPVYEGLYKVELGDVARGTNCLHAALVEMKAQGAQDFMMVGQGTFPIAAIMKE